MELLVAFFAESCYIERQRGLRGRDSNMRIIIVGDGKMGSTFAQRLSKAGHDVTIIDKRATALQHTIESLDIMAMEEIKQ